MILALTGGKRIHRQECAEYIHSKWSFLYCDFTGKLRRALDQIYQLTYKFDWDCDTDVPCDELYGKTKSEVLRAIGPGFRQLLGPEFFINSLIPKAHQANGHFLKMTDVVIVDLRFPNELEYLRQFDPLVIYLNVPGVEPVDNDYTFHTYMMENADYQVITDDYVERLEQVEMCLFTRTGPGQRMVRLDDGRAAKFPDVQAFGKLRGKL